MAAGWLGGEGVSTTEPACLLLAAAACGGRNPHACHSLGSFGSVMPGGLAPYSSPAPWQLPVLDRSRTTGVSWFTVGQELVNETWGQECLQGAPTFHFIPLLEGVSHREGPAVHP